VGRAVTPVHINCPWIVGGPRIAERAEADDIAIEPSKIEAAYTKFFEEKVPA